MAPLISARGVVHVDNNMLTFLVTQCSFQDINITGSGGNVIRIGGTSSTPDTDKIATINDTIFKSINSRGDSNNRGGSAIFALMGQESLLNISYMSVFDSLKCTNGDGGAIYASLADDA